MRIKKSFLTMPGLLGSYVLSMCIAWAAGPGPVPTGRGLKTGAELALAKPAGPPVSLTASDGTGLQIVALSARAVVEDPLAFTELHLTFRNPQPRQLEGNFEITLPPGAAISRFAMRQDQSWQEGEVVELQAARAAYEDFLHRRQDPALLEKQAGNQFHARVFPIPPAGEKELIVSYSQERAQKDEPFRIYLRGLPQLQRLDIHALVGKTELGASASSLGGTTMAHQSVDVQKTDFTPDVDFEVAVPTPEKGQERLGLRHDNLVVARVTPITQAQPDVVDSAVILLDTSASRALGFADQVTALGALVGKLRQRSGLQMPLRVICFDQDVEEVYAGPASGFGDAHLQRIAQRRALGASDLSKALAFLAQPAGNKGRSYHRVLLLTDGIATAGELEAPGLRTAVQHLQNVGVRRLDAITFGGIRDETLLGRLVTAGLPSDGVVADGERPVAELSNKLQNATFSHIKIAVPGSSWTWPVELNGVQPGDQVLVYADLPPGQNQPFEVVLEGARSERLAVPLATVPRPLLERAWVNARIHRIQYQRDTLAASDPDLREGLKHQIIDLSTKYRVLSDYTALLVLETEQDYARFKIDRRALADILTVGPTGIELYNRKQATSVVLATPPPAPPPLAQLATSMAAEKPEPMRARHDSAGAGKKSKAQEVMDQPQELAAATPAPSPSAPPPPPPASPAAGAPAGPGLADPVAKAPAASPRRSNSYSFSDDPVEGDLVRPDGNMVDRREARPSPARASVARPAEAEVQEQQAALRGARMRVRAEAAERRPSTVLAIPPREPEVIPYEGKLLAVMNLLKDQKRSEALQQAWAWRDQDAGDVLALIALGEVFEALGQKKAAARAYGSLIDLYPGRADLRRFAGERLERLGAEGLALASDTYAQARSQRPDHPASHRLLAYALLKAGKPAEAFAVIAEGAARTYPPGRFAGVPQILSEDVGLIAAAWLSREPRNRQAILDRLAALGVPLPTQPSVRFVLNWETDANDVDFHIYDGHGGHAFYSQRALPSGGQLYADVTTGYGPECFTIPGRPGAYPYKLQAHYYSRGPMGYGMGKLETIEHDGHGGLRFIERPFVIMVDRAFVDLGQLLGPIK